MTFHERDIPKSPETLQAIIDRDLKRSHEGFHHLAAQLAAPIKEHVYSSIMTDKRGGILPAIVINGLARRWATATGGRPPTEIDLPGGKWWYRIDEQAYIRRVKSSAGRRALVVTEVLAGGEGSGIVYSDLVKGGIALDVAAFQTYLSPDRYMERERWGRHGDVLRDTKIYQGIQSMEGDILNRTALVVARCFEEDPAQDAYETYTRPEQAFLISAARRYLETLADELYEQHF